MGLLNKSELEIRVRNLEAGNEKLRLENDFLNRQVAMFFAALQKYANPDNWATIVDRRFGSPQTNHAFKGVKDSEKPYSIAQGVLNDDRVNALGAILAENERLRRENEELKNEYLSGFEHDFDGENQPISS